MRRHGVALTVLWVGSWAGLSAAAPGTQSATPPPAPAASAAPASEASPSPAAPLPEAPSSTAPASPTTPPPVNGEPPLYYVEPPSDARAPDGRPDGVYEPPLPEAAFFEPPPPPPVSRDAPPRTALWLGARAAWFVPFGVLWLDGFGTGNGSLYRRRNFSDYAGPGPSFEVDVGARLGRHYNVFALWEHASLGVGNLDDRSFGGQERGATNLYGAGLRFSTDPSSVGFAMEFALGYRDFSAYWTDGTRLSLTDGWIDARIGLGAEIRLARSFSLSPMFVLGAGSFGSARWSGPRGARPALDAFDDAGQYGTFGLQLGAHFDVF